MTDKQKLFIQALFGRSKGDVQLARETAGYSENTSIKEIITTEVAKEIEERTRQAIASLAPKAVFTLADSMGGKDDALGRKERQTAAKEFLDRSGFSKTEKMEVVAKDPLFILPAKSKTDDED